MQKTALRLLHVKIHASKFVTLCRSAMSSTRAWRKGQRLRKQVRCKINSHNEALVRE